MLPIPEIKIPITEIKLQKNVRLFIKRDDVIHPNISGNKYWKLLGSINDYLAQRLQNPMLVSFGGAYSNHIAALSAVGKIHNIPTLGIIRGNEVQDRWQHNPTLKFAAGNGMKFRFVTREEYRNKELISGQMKSEFPNALIIPEGGTNLQAVEGIKNMLNSETQQFDYLCTAVGTGGTVAGISKFAENHQKVLGFKVVNDISLHSKITPLSKKNNFDLVEAHFGGYGKISDELIRFINAFSAEHSVQLDPVYTGKMMMKIFEMIDHHYFPPNSTILAFHTGGLQGIEGANALLKAQKRDVINRIISDV